MASHFLQQFLDDPVMVFKDIKLFEVIWNNNTFKIVSTDEARKYARDFSQIPLTGIMDGEYISIFSSIFGGPSILLALECDFRPLLSKKTDVNVITCISRSIQATFQNYNLFNDRPFNICVELPTTQFNFSLVNGEDMEIEFMMDFSKLLDYDTCWIVSSFLSLSFLETSHIINDTQGTHAWNNILLILLKLFKLFHIFKCNKVSIFDCINSTTGDFTNKKKVDILDRILQGIIHVIFQLFCIDFREVIGDFTIMTHFSPCLFSSLLPLLEAAIENIEVIEDPESPVFSTNLVDFYLSQH